MALPIDIRLHILEYILPLNKDSSKSITFEIAQSRINEITARHYWTTSPSEHAIARFLRGIGLVNNKLHAESMKILYARSFILDFHKTNIMSAHPGWWDSAANRGLPQHWLWGKIPPGNRGDFFLGLDFGRIRELHILVRPSGVPDFWTCLVGSVGSLCRALSPRIVAQGLKRLMITVGEDEGPGEAGITQPHEVMALLETMWRYLRGMSWCGVAIPGQLTPTEEQKCRAQVMVDDICSPWMEGDWVANEEVPVPEKPYIFCRRINVPIPLSDLTAEDIENDNLFTTATEWISEAEITFQDYMHERFQGYWVLANRMEYQSGVLQRRSECGRCFYFWENEEENLYLEEHMWDRTYLETDDDFYRKRDVLGEHGPQENEWFIDACTEGVEDHGSSRISRTIAKRWSQCQRMKIRNDLL